MNKHGIPLDIHNRTIDNDRPFTSRKWMESMNGKSIPFSLFGARSEI